MTIGADREPVPESDDDRPGPNARRQPDGKNPGFGQEQVSHSEDTAHFRGRRAADERHRLMHFAGRILTSPGATFRALACIAVLLVLVILGAGLLGVRLDVGPLHIGPALGQTSQH